MKETATLKIKYSEGTDGADAPAITEPMAKRIEELLLAIPATQITGGADKNLLIVQGTGAAAFKAMSGDITISNAGVTAIGALKVVTGMLADLAVTTAKLDNSAVTEAKIANLAVSAVKLADNSVETAKVKDGAVTTSKILDGTIAGTDIGADTITATNLAPSAVATSELAANAVETAKIKDLVVTNAKIADSTITDSKLAVPVIVGEVSGAGAKVIGSGFTCAKTGTGLYTVTLDTELATSGVILVIPTGVAGTLIPNNTGSSKKVFGIEIRNTAGTLVNWAFHFMIKAA